MIIYIYNIVYIYIIILLFIYNIIIEKTRYHAIKHRACRANGKMEKTILLIVPGCSIFSWKK